MTRAAILDFLFAELDAAPLTDGDRAEIRIRLKMTSTELLNTFYEEGTIRHTIAYYLAEAEKVSSTEGGTKE